MLSKGCNEGCLEGVRVAQSQALTAGGRHPGLKKQRCIEMNTSVSLRATKTFHKHLKKQGVDMHNHLARQPMETHCDANVKNYCQDNIENAVEYCPKVVTLLSEPQKLST
jgi:hypothetical protein